MDFLDFVDWVGDAIISLWNTLDTVIITEHFSMLDFLIDGFLITAATGWLYRKISPTYQEHNQFGGKD